MLKVYAAHWCPHCKAAVEFLESHHIPYEYHDVDRMDAETEKLLDEVNDGEWRVPTLENEGKWSPGRPFQLSIFQQELTRIGVIF